MSLLGDDLVFDAKSGGVVNRSVCIKHTGCILEHSISTTQHHKHISSFRYNRDNGRKKQDWNFPQEMCLLKSPMCLSSEFPTHLGPKHL